MSKQMKTGKTVQDRITKEAKKQIDVSRETVDLSKIDVGQIAKWIQGDLQRCIALMTAVLENPAVIDELAEAFYSKVKTQQAQKEAAGIV